MDRISIAENYIRELCAGERAVGTEGNRQSTEFAARVFRGEGLAVETPWFECMDWTSSGCRLEAGGEEFSVLASPYSLPCETTAELACVSSLEELRACDAAGRILLLRGEIVAEQLIPRGFTFYNPPEHREMHRLFEESGALALVAATSRNPGLAGGVYPFPFIEDGDFAIPCAHMKDTEGDRLAVHVGRRVSLSIKARRIPARGCNVVARSGDCSGQRIVVCAHIDSKLGSPGAIDNASGVTVLLLLAGLLRDRRGGRGVEIVALNGEDYFSTPGQAQYLASIGQDTGRIALAVNIDGAGYHEGPTAVSLYNLEGRAADLVRARMLAFPGFEEGPPWVQSDHGMFAAMGIPAAAVTSHGFMETLAAEIIHTADDRPEIVDCGRLVTIAEAIAGLVEAY